jgi:hypothetical protein
MLDFEPDQNDTFGSGTLSLIDIDAGAAVPVLQVPAGDVPMFPLPALWSSDSAFLLFTLNGQLMKLGRDTQSVRSLNTEAVDGKITYLYGWER